MKRGQALEGCGIGYDPKGVIEVRDVRSDARQPAAPLWTGLRGIPFENAPASRMNCSGVLWLWGRRLGPQRLLSRRVQCSVVARFEDPESAYLWRRSVGVEAVSDYRIKNLTCTWHGGRTVHSVPHVSRAVLSAIGRRNVPVPARRRARQPLVARTGMSYGPRDREVGARVRYDAMGRPVQFRSGIRALDCDLRRSTLALFVHSVRVRFTILCINETPYTQRSCVAVGCSTSGSPCAMMSETLHASTDAGFTVATYEQRCFSDLCRLVISVDSATVWIKSG